MYNFQNSTQDINENNILISEYFKILETKGKEELNTVVNQKINEILEFADNDLKNTLTDINEILELPAFKEVAKLERLQEIVKNILNDNVIYQDLDTKVKEKLNLLINSILAIDTINNSPLIKKVLEKYKDNLVNLTNNIDTVLNFNSKVESFLEQNKDLKNILNVEYLEKLGINLGDNKLNSDIVQEENNNLGIS